MSISMALNVLLGGGEGGPRPQNVLVYNTSLMKFPMRLFVSV